MWPERLLPGHDAVYRTSQARAPRPVHLSKITNNEDIALIQIVSFLGESTKDLLSVKKGKALNAALRDLRFRSCV